MSIDLYSTNFVLNRVLPIKFKFRYVIATSYQIYDRAIIGMVGELEETTELKSDTNY